MNYYFPSFIQNPNIKQEILPQLEVTVNSGTNALRLLLRSFNLTANDKVAVPSFVCNSVKQAVEQEKLAPALFDLKPDNSFWTSYNFDRIKTENIKVIILVHLYGFIHPDTNEIINYCETNKIKLIHDAAQSYGIDEQFILRGDGIVYSFGPGKSTTAAGGAWIKNFGGNKSFFTFNKPTLLSFQNTKGRLFLKSRIFGYQFNQYEKLLNVIVNKIHSTSIFRMSDFQLKMASYSISNLKEVIPFRKKRYNILKTATVKNSLLKIAYEDNNGLYFKIIFFVENEVDKFKAFLNQNDVPFFTLFNETEKIGLENFDKNATKFIEISCETSIPENEIERIVGLLNSYK
ncbi:MAG TPA: DegT/DnrJ/EryC1/StrS family aminotransferase [Bacteroidia bacterium]|nr:DegT/DnrJ/EryC1/StrS family aminotransferase [Bacteroidia bacterium]